MLLKILIPMTAQYNQVHVGGSVVSMVESIGSFSNVWD